MKKYFYNVFDAFLGKVLYSFDFPETSEEEDAAHALTRDSLNNFKDLIGEEGFKKFWTQDDEDRTFVKFDGDVNKYIEVKLNPYKVLEVLDEDNNIIWKSDKFKN